MARYHRRRHRRRYGAFITMPGFTGVGKDAMRAVKHNLPLVLGGGAAVVGGTVLLKWLLSATKLEDKVPPMVARFYPLLGGIAGGLGLGVALKAAKKPQWANAALAGGVIAGGATVLVGYLWDLGPLKRYADFVTLPSMAEYAGYNGVIVDNYITGNPGYNDYAGVIVDNPVQSQVLSDLSASAMSDYGNEDMMERLAP